MQDGGLQILARGGIISAFTRLRRMLADVPAGNPRPIEMTVGEPRETMPDFVVEKMREAEATLAKYPAIRCSDELREATAEWLTRRYGIKGGIDAASEVHPLNGSREGLFFGLLPAVGRKADALGPSGQRPAVLMPNPYYHAYIGSALAANAEPVYLPAVKETGFLPDLEALAQREDLLRRTAAFYVCSPSNPQGAMASSAYLKRALELARAYDFMLLVDECYSEIYFDAPPPGGLEVAAKTPERFRNILVFNSLSKRSNLPGLRVGFTAGDPDYLETLAEMRNLIAPQMPGVIQHAAAAVWRDEAHVTAIREAYREKFRVCDEVLPGHFEYRRPDGGFFLWLNMERLGGGYEATVTLWKRSGVKVVPGGFLAQPGEDGVNVGEPYVRVALVHDTATIREALERMVGQIQ